MMRAGGAISKRERLLPRSRLYGRGQPPDGPGPHLALAGIPAAGRQAPAVGAERDTPDDADVLDRREYLFAGGDVPDPDRAVVAGRGEVARPRVERHRVDPACVPPQGSHLVAG